MGEILGSAIAAYLVCKLLEWLVIKRVIRNHSWMVVVSAAVVGMLFILAFRYQVEVRGSYDSNDERLFGSQVIAVVLLPIIRILWRNIRIKKRAEADKSA